MSFFSPSRINLNLFTPNRFARKSTSGKDSIPSRTSYSRKLSANHCAALMNCALKLLFCRPTPAYSFIHYTKASRWLFSLRSRNSRHRHKHVVFPFIQLFTSRRREMSYVTFSLEVTVGVIPDCTSWIFCSLRLFCFSFVLFFFLNCKTADGKAYDDSESHCHVHY